MKGLLFFIGILTVLSQAIADCVEEVLESKPHNTHDICSYELNWALIPHPHDCHKFFVCANHVPEEYTCAENYFFDPKQRRCLLGSCSEIKECHNWIRRVAEDCHAFEICDNGNYIREYCQPNSYFSEELGICVPISNTPEHKCSCIYPNYSVLKNTENCETYYACTNGKAVLQQCPHGQYFDAFLNSCVLDVRGVCLTATPMSPDEKEILEICERFGLRDNDDDEDDYPGRVIFQADNEDCSKFYMCTNGRVLTKYCPQGFFFNRELRFCEVDEDGLACVAIREQAKKKQQEKGKEASTKEEEKHHQVELNHQHEEEEHKPPVHMSLSMTHVKVNVEKNGTDVKHTETDTIKVGQIETSIVPVPPVIVPQLLEAEPSIVPVPPVIVPQLLELESVEENEVAHDDEEMVNNSAEVQEVNSFEMKLPLSELKLPTNSNYDKLASKFMSF